MGRSVKVGIFVLSGIVLMGLIVFFIGDSKNMWEPKLKYQANFRNVSGMKPGSPVRMGGVDIGAVVSVVHVDDPKDSSVLVKFNVVRTDAQRIRKGVPGPDGKITKATTALVANKGFLGDKMLELTADGDGEWLPGGSQLPSDEGSDPLAQIQAIGARAESVLKNLEQGTKPLADPQLAEDLKQGVHSLRVILDTIAKEDSIMHRVIASPEDGARFSTSLDNLRASSVQLREFSTRMNTGPGLAHTLVYDPETASHAAGAVAEVHQDLKAIREGNGLVHALVYGDTDTTHLMGNVNAMSDDLRAIVGDIRKGRGTMGALLVDPSLYEDLKSLVGNMDRNQVLRALVRYSIQADEGRPNPQVTVKK